MALAGAAAAAKVAVAEKLAGVAVAVAAQVLRMHARAGQAMMMAAAPGGDAPPPGGGDDRRGTRPDFQEGPGEEEEEEMEYDEVHWLISQSDGWQQTEKGRAWAGQPMRLFLRNGPKHCNKCSCFAYMGGGVGCVSPQCQANQQRAYMEGAADSHGSIPAVMYPAAHCRQTGRTTTIELDAMSTNGSNARPWKQIKRRKQNKGQARGRPLGPPDNMLSFAGGLIGQRSGESDMQD